MSAGNDWSAEIVLIILTWSILWMYNVVQFMQWGPNARGRNLEMLSKPFCPQHMSTEVGSQRFLANQHGTVF